MYNRAYTALDQSDELIHNYHPPLFFFFLSPFVFPTALFSSLHSLPFLLLLSRCPALPLSCPGNGPIEKACCLGHTREAAFIGDGGMEGKRSGVFSSDCAGGVILTFFCQQIQPHLQQIINTFHTYWRKMLIILHYQTACLTAKEQRQNAG